jgi:hypothetical protein
MSTLVYNAIRTPDGTVLESLHRHDYKTYLDKNGKEYMVDGGLEYVRRNVHDDAPYEDLSVYTTDGHEKVREVVKWGTYGINGDQPLTRILLKDMNTEHIQACLDNVSQMHPAYKEAFKEELKLRSI